MRRIAIAACIALAGLAATSALAIEPGEWTTSTRMTDIQLPADMPAEMGAMMRRMMMENVTTASSCITQEQIDNAPQQMFRETQGECDYSHFEMANGVLDAAAQCRSDQGNMDMTMTGSYTDTTYAMEMHMVLDGPMGQMQMTAHTDGQRTGPCT